MQHGAKHKPSVTTLVIVASITIATCEAHQAPLHAGAQGSDQGGRHHAGRPHAAAMEMVRLLGYYGYETRMENLRGSHMAAKC